MGGLAPDCRSDIRHFLGGAEPVSPAISEACRLVGTARAGDETAAAIRRASPALSAYSTAFVISSTNKGMPSVRSTISAITSAGSSLLPTRRSMMVAASRSPSSIERQARYMRLAYPRRIELGTESYDEQRRKERLIHDRSRTKRPHMEVEVEPGIPLAAQR